MKIYFYLVHCTPNLCTQSLRVSRTYNLLRKQSFSEMHFSTPGVVTNQMSLILSSFYSD